MSLTSLLLWRREVDNTLRCLCLSMCACSNEFVMRGVCLFLWKGRCWYTVCNSLVLRALASSLDYYTAHRYMWVTPTCERRYFPKGNLFLDRWLVSFLKFTSFSLPVWNQVLYTGLWRAREVEKKLLFFYKYSNLWDRTTTDDETTVIITVTTRTTTITITITSRG